MASVLIPTHVEDTHAIAVERSLAIKGHRALRWFGSDCPSSQTQSITIDPWVHLQVRDHHYGDFNSDDFDVLWYRRPSRPVLPQSLMETDREVAEASWRSFFTSSWFAFERNKFVVNPVGSFDRSNSKAAQLSAAAQCGLTIPRTLISNDPDRIRAFVADNRAGTIFKTFYPFHWKVGERMYAARTVGIAEHDVTSEFALRSAPGIYQERIAKAYELRVTFFGQVYIAVKLNSQVHLRGQLDWRSVPVDQLSHDQVEIPSETAEKCRRLMKALGIVFGCFDLIVTPDGDHVFVEVNEMGQFLWIENVNPAIGMLDTFCNFLISKDPEYAGGSYGPTVTWSEIFHSDYFKTTLDNDRAIHVKRDPVILLHESA